MRDLTLVNRWYQILDSLVHHKFLHFNELQKALGISAHTLAKSIEQLNETLSDILVVVQEQGKVELTIRDYEGFERVLLGKLRKETDFNSSSKRSRFLLKRLILSKTPLLIDDLAEELDVSRGTIAKDLKKAKQLAKDYRVSIIGIPNRGLELYGDELDLRLLFIHEVYKYFGYDNQEEIEMFVETLSIKYRIPLKVRDLLVKTLCVASLRIKEQNNMIGPVEHYHNPVNGTALLDEVCYQLETSHRISLSQYEIDFISLPLSIQYIENLNYSEEKENKELRKVFNHMTKKVSEHFALTFDSDALYDDMKTHLNFLINRLIFRVQTEDIFMGEIQEKYPLAFEVARMAADLLGNYYQYEVSLVEVSYLALYFESIFRKDYGQEGMAGKHIAVVCTTGHGTANIIMRQLRRVLGGDIEISRYTEEAFSEEDLKSYFAIFTTIPLKFTKSETPIIHLTKLFDEQWLRDEWQKARLYHQKNLETLRLMFTKLNIEKNYEAYLNTMVDELIDRKIVRESFRKGILSREANQSTIFGGGIAFPHTINEHGTAPFLMLGIPEFPLQTEHGEVLFIFMVGIPAQLSEKSQEELLELYDDIFRVAIDQELRNELRGLKSEKSFKDLTKKRGVF
ncbi:BglG family transcription antiterminator [Streptococcus rifensis]